MMRVSEYLEAESESSRKEPRRMLAKYPADGQVHPITLSTGESLIHEDDPSNMVYYLMKGRVSVVTNQTGVSRYTLTKAAAPEFFGEYEAFGEILRYITEIRTVAPCKLTAFPVDACLLWVRCDQELFFLHVRWILNSYVNQMANECSLHLLDSDGRVIQFLIRVYEKCGGISESVRLTYTRMEIAETTGNSVHTVNRAVSRLVAKHLVSVKNGKLQITAAQYEALKKEMEPFLLKQSLRRADYHLHAPFPHRRSERKNCHDRFG